MTVRNLVSEILKCRRVFQKREFNKPGECWFPIKEKNVTVEIKSVDGMIYKVKSVKLKAEW